MHAWEGNNFDKAFNTRIFFPLFIYYVIVLLSRSGRDDDMDQGRGQIVYNVHRLVQGQIEIRKQVKQKIDDPSTIQMLST